MNATSRRPGGSASARTAEAPRYVCVHGHFYQPPRESPWLEAIEEQPSARPFHDWNERVSAECYRPNAFARILDGRGHIERIVNNYQRISWNFGPTLLSWMEGADPELYAALQEADRERVRRTGHGAGMAQAYGHAILPLCNARDQETHVRWGVADFRHRFGRAPRGMWLAETACDTASLEALARNGIELTVLAPHQALKARAAGGRWHDARGSKIDPRRPYTVQLPSGRSIAAFFYDGPASRGVAFERLLEDGLRFRDRLTSLFDPRSGEPQIAHIATDGESYGHHHRFGEMALAYALDALERDPSLSLTTYEEMLTRHPPTYEAAIIEASSWSCAHGVERWRSDCGCSTGGRAGWSQAWRAPLREALDGLRDGANARWEPAAGQLFHDPWGARDRYVEVLLDPRAETREAFLFRELRGAGEGPIDPATRVRALELLELQRNLILMYTSCGWFFADLGGIETVQILRYAARALELCAQHFGDELRAPFLATLSRARSNPVEGKPEGEDGAALFLREAAGSAVDLSRAAAHFAARSLFASAPNDSAPGFTVRELDRHEEQAGKSKLAMGTMEVSVRATGRAETFEHAAIHLGDHNLGGGARPLTGDATFRTELTAAFRRYELPEVLRALERHFVGRTFSLRSLFFDEQARVLHELLGDTERDVDHAYQKLYEEHASLMRYLATLSQEPPPAMRHAASFALSARLRDELRKDRPDVSVLRGTAEEARASNTVLDGAIAAPRVGETLVRLIESGAPEPLDAAIALAELIASLRLPPHRLDRAEEALVRGRDARPADPAVHARLARLGELLRVSF